jgi:hypothetical protein
MPLGKAVSVIMLNVIEEESELAKDYYKTDINKLTKKDKKNWRVKFCQFIIIRFRQLPAIFF